MCLNAEQRKSFFCLDEAAQTNSAYNINYMRSEPKMRNQYPEHILTSQAEIRALAEMLLAQIMSRTSAQILTQV